MVVSLKMNIYYVKEAWLYIEPIISLVIIFLILQSIFGTNIQTKVFDSIKFQ